jgi:uncharacterized membrane protein YccC
VLKTGFNLACDDGRIAAPLDSEGCLRAIPKDRLRMDAMELEAVVKNIDRQLSRVEQILPGLATRDDLKTFATKEDLKAFATKEDLKAFATKDDLRQESERTRQHFNVVAERLEGYIRLIAEGHVALQERIEEIDQRFGRAIAALDQRVLRLEAR